MTASTRAWLVKIGLAALPVVFTLVELWRLNHGRHLQAIAALLLSSVGLVVVLLLYWRSLRRTGSHERTALEHSKFLAAAETSLDAFSIFEPVRDAKGSIIDFRYQYANANTEKITLVPRAEMLGKLMCEVSPVIVAAGLFDQCCTVMETGEACNDEFSVGKEGERRAWLRCQIVRLDDLLAMTCSNITRVKTTPERYKQLAEFNDSIFQNAPFGIIATDTNGMITAMNLASEKLTGYSREELVGRAPMTMLHDDLELTRRGIEMAAQGEIRRSGFDVLSSRAAAGQMEEHEWGLIRKDGATTPINLAMRAVTTDAGEVTGFVGIAFDITERQQMLSYVTHLATHDQLTGLVGRALLQDKTVEAVERASRNGTKVAAFLIDLDHFKRINDWLGHASGDEILLETANRLRRAVRSSDTVARVGGDEFVVIMPDITRVSDVEQCAVNLVAKLAPEIAVEDQMVQLTASVGVCVYPDFAADAKHLLKRADSAMYAAKEGGRNQHQIFSEDMLKETANRLSMEHALRHALANGELCMHYQPQVSLTTGMVTGMEALLRWTHPRYGSVPPSQFITIAEETGLIVPIGEWAFMTACCEGRALQQELGMELTVSINLSPRQFQQNNLVPMIERALAASGLPVRSLEVEITENMLMVNSGGNLDKLQRIRELGAGISIDDFGTGFCSFSYLLQYHVDRLKIDQSFVRQAVTDANAAAVVRTILAMSHGLNIRVVAEGVETDEQLRFLFRRRCDEAQGNYFAPPVAAQDFSAAVMACSGTGVLQSL